ncbi:hypothetical protein [Lentzea jiangxiensis]|uniref:Uncharacterized protein n=1 Tax=Lentzea jiangxiensis TaxID=641025 RepID=A0A1H0VX99_9PSEU|nr:hypothetical protein [Lentzea jiangxiensis]SDP82901.1 hypothetical protein SAMN05421507_11629 [Lentzea jiangxiensis]
MFAVRGDPRRRNGSAATLVSTEIGLVPGDITRQQVDIVVTAATESLPGGTAFPAIATRTIRSSPTVATIRLVTSDRETHYAIAVTFGEDRGRSVP